MKSPWYSSYEQNNYGELFYSLIRVYQPDKVVELGTKAGYSAYHIARGLKTNGKGTLDCYDLWEDYEFNSVPKSVAEENLKEFKNIISFKLSNAIGIDKIYKTVDPVRSPKLNKFRQMSNEHLTSNGVDMLHVDVSNHGEILEKIIPYWINKTRQFIIIEGGSSERDQVRWMIQFNKLPIKNWLEDFARKRSDIEYFTIEPFPSVTIIRKTLTPLEIYE